MASGDHRPGWGNNLTRVGDLISPGQSADAKPFCNSKNEVWQAHKADRLAYLQKVFEADLFGASPNASALGLRMGARLRQKPLLQ